MKFIFEDHIALFGEHKIISCNKDGFKYEPIDVPEEHKVRNLEFVFEDPGYIYKNGELITIEIEQFTDIPHIIDNFNWINENSTFIAQKWTVDIGKDQQTINVVIFESWSWDRMMGKPLGNIVGRIKEEMADAEY